MPAGIAMTPTPMTLNIEAKIFPVTVIGYTSP